MEGELLLPLYLYRFIRLDFVTINQQSFLTTPLLYQEDIKVYLYDDFSTADTSSPVQYDAESEKSNGTISTDQCQEEGNSSFKLSKDSLYVRTLGITDMTDKEITFMLWDNGAAKGLVFCGLGTSSQRRGMGTIASNWGNDNYYWYRDSTQSVFESTGILKTAGWHKFKYAFTASETDGMLDCAMYIDGTHVYTIKAIECPTGFEFVSVQGDVYIDDFKVSDTTK